MLSAHPLADEWTDEYALFVVEHDRVSYSRPLWHFLADCRSARLRPVLVTGPAAILSPHLYTAMVEHAALWAIRDEQGVFDARTGVRVRAISDLWTGAATGDRRAQINADGPFVPAVLFDVYAGDRAVDETTIGPLADHAVRSLGGGDISRFGREEPLVAPWDHGALTLDAKLHMPTTPPMLAASHEGAWASLTVARTRDGLVERLQGGVPLPQLADVPFAELRDRVMPLVTAMLDGLVERFRPRVALVSSGILHRHADMVGYRAGAQAVEAPLAVLIGPRAVRDLGLDFDALAQHHDVTVLGPGRVPSAMVRMTGRDPLWAQLRAFVFDLDQERLAALLAAEMPRWT